MGVWLIAALCGVIGASAGELLELHASIRHDGIWPWQAKHGSRVPLGVCKYVVQAIASMVLGGMAAVAVYGQNPPPGGVPAHAIITLAAAGFAAPAVLQKLGNAVRRLGTCPSATRDIVRWYE